MLASMAMATAYITLALNLANAFSPLGGATGPISAARTKAARINGGIMSNTEALPAARKADADHARALLLLLASRFTPETTKATALQQLMDSPAERREALLEEALTAVDANEGALFAGRRWPVPLPSRRAALGGYSRLLDSMMDEEPGSGARFTEGGDVAKRRRFLGVVFRQLQSNKGGIWGLEREARKRLRASASIEEMLRRTPSGLETPKYEVIASRPSWEVRKYNEFSVASTQRNRSVSAEGVKLQQPTMQAAGGFQALAGYIFGKNIGPDGQSEKMAMTTPVFNSASKGTMSFVLPSRYWANESDGGAAPPKPVDASVQIVRKGGGALEESETLACLWFGGFAGKAEVARRKLELLQSIRADGEFEPEVEPAEESIVLMQYNDPFTPPWKRRNEVAMPVRRKRSSVVKPA